MRKRRTALSPPPGPCPLPSFMALGQTESLGLGAPAPVAPDALDGPVEDVVHLEALPDEQVPEGLW